MTTEYPFWARWVVNGVNAADITSVNYIIASYNPATNVFDTEDTGTISSSIAGKWIAPYDVPNTPGTVKYLASFNPIGGAHPLLHDEVIATDGVVNGTSTVTTGTETHSGVVCDPSGTPLEGVAVRAVPHGTSYTFVQDTTNASGEYTLTGLHENHAYDIEFNKDGYWAKAPKKVIA